MGLGYATTRDFVSFLRNDAKDAAGNANPVFGIKTTLCQGISSSGMYLRDYVYQGFNVDDRSARSARACTSTSPECRNCT